MGPLTSPARLPPGPLGTPRPRLLWRYLLREFLRNFGLAMAGITLLILLGNLFDELHRLLRYHPPAGAVAAYFACKLPYLVSQATPLAVLLGTLLTLNALLRSHELVAMRSGGLSQWAVAAPFLLPAFGISLAMIAFNEAVVPRANRAAREIKQYRIRKLPVTHWRLAGRVAVWTSDGRLVYAEHANGEEEVLRRVTVAELYGRKLLGRVDAEAARPAGSSWVLEGAQTYRWRRGDVELRRSRQMPYALGASLADFFQEERELKEMTLTELARKIRSLQTVGREYRNEQVFFHLKWAFPFANLIVALLALGISFTFQTNPREGMAYAFGVALLSAFTYIGLVQFGQAMGIGGVLPPVIAMWLANVVFFAGGVVLLRRAWRW